MVAARLLGREPGSLTRSARCGVRGRASLNAAYSDHLIPRHDSDGEGVGAMAQDLVGAVIDQLKRWNQAAPTENSSAGSSLGRSVLELCLGKEGAETCKVLDNFSTMMSTENS